MDTSGFLTLVAVILTALSLTSKGKKVTYSHKIGRLHKLLLFIMFVLVIYSLFYDTFKAQNLLLPWYFVEGFDEKQLLLCASLITSAALAITFRYCETRKSNLIPLCKDIRSLLNRAAFSDLTYVLQNNIYFLEKHMDENITRKTLIEVILSNKYTSFLQDNDYKLLLELLRIDSKNDVFIAKFNEFISQQLDNHESQLLWEIAILYRSYSPRVPSANTPMLEYLYANTDASTKYSIYECIGNSAQKYVLDTNNLNTLNISPNNVQTDSIINTSQIAKYIFIFFNLLKYDLIQKKPLRFEHSIRTPWIFNKFFLRPLIQIKIELRDFENEFNTRIDYFIYESILSFERLLHDVDISYLDDLSSQDLIECVANCIFQIISSNKFEDEFKEEIIKLSIAIYSELGNNKQFAELCFRSFIGDKVCPYTPPSKFEIKKIKDSSIFFEDADLT
ncbi:hypothetical protein [Pseudoalteromonas sp. 1_2015MBL_MicDiv]|uniref:hypothetical protein n=1 Tax=Pseudoalteromonas sp. 1_2015MBL_MicDiv TaxID=1720343 RepID=UPI000BBE6484|nr:hypothetical protein [Pseudoalteromonas sp. 1_2015MBL_MicDiv]ATG77836.1 hypothetical protein AOR04_09980 [Pseudoalteromonas sp. 1_2015MBL_MicDiv]